MRAFTFGKFLPFHLGHQRMVEFASQQCQELFVLVCGHEGEPISVEIRTSWLEETFQNHPKIKIIPFSYSESQLPSTSVASDWVSRKWSEAFQHLLPSVQAVITSEPYGDLVAKYMNIEHIPFNPDRDQTPNSATVIRNNLSKNWGFLPLSTQKSFQQKVVLLGTESVGKSTMAKQLAKYFGGSLVEEAGRETIPDSQADYKKADLIKTAELHAQWISDAQSEGKKTVFIDTDVVITQSYAKHTFDEYLKLPSWIYDTNKADLYLYLCNDVPFIQDGGRLEQADRDALDISHRNTLHHFGIAYTEINGDWQERWEQAVKAVEILHQNFNFESAIQKFTI